MFDPTLLVKNSKSADFMKFQKDIGHFRFWTVLENHLTVNFEIKIRRLFIIKSLISVDFTHNTAIYTVYHITSKRARLSWCWPIFMVQYQNVLVFENHVFPTWKPFNESISNWFWDPVFLNAAFIGGFDSKST